MYTNTAIYWDTMHLIICRSTTPDIFKSVNRLEEFVVQQLQSSKKMLSSWKPPGLETEGSQELPGGGHRRPPASSGKQTKNATEKVAMVTPGAKRKLKKQVSLKPEVIGKVLVALRCNFMYYNEYPNLIVVRLNI